MISEPGSASPAVGSGGLSRRRRKAQRDGRPLERRRFLLFAAILVLAALPVAVDDFVPWITPPAGLLVLVALVRGPRGRRPPLAFLLALSAAAFAGTFLHYGTINGLRAGGSLLLCLVGLKLLETRHERDLNTVLLLTVFLLATDLFFGQQLTAVAYVAAVFVFLLAAWIGSGTTSVPPHGEKPLAPARSGLRPALGLLAWALPWALVLFVFIPRVHGPLWGWGRRHAWVSGLSPNLQLGGIGRLIVSRRTVMTVRFVRPRPPTDQRYFRVYVFNRFGGKEWQPSRRALEPAPPVAENNDVKGARVAYRVLLRPDGRSALAVLGRPLTVPEGAWLTRAGTLRARRPLRRSFHYSLVALRGPRPAPQLSARARARDLELPPGVDRRARRLARRWRRRYPRPSVLVERVLRYFHDEPFYYTLHPPPLHGRNAVDMFLFRTRRGFCTDYATAFAVLMRAAGVPTRVVSGYLGGRYDPLNGRVVFNGADAHAWDEVWIRGAWRRVDPTAAIARSRISLRALSLLTGGYTVGGFDVRESRWLTRVGDFWRRIGAVWNRDVLGYGPRLQRAFLRRLGWRIRGWRSWLPILIGVLVVPPLLLWGLVLLENKRRRGTRGERDWERLLHRLGALFPPAIAPGETALEFAGRIARSHPTLGRRFLTLARRRGRVLYEPGSGPVELRRYRKTLRVLRARLARISLSPPEATPTRRRPEP